MPRRPASIRVHLAQIAPSLGDVPRNCDLHLERIAKAREDGADLVVFPELSLTGYWLHDLVGDLALDPDTDTAVATLREASREVDLVVGLVEDAGDGRAFNSAVYLRQGEVVFRHRKVHLPTYSLFDEGRYFAPGDRVRATRAPACPTGVLICEDMWHPALPWVLAEDGCELLLVPSSGPGRGVGAEAEGLASQRDWRLLGESAARFHGQFVVYVNRTGSEDGYTFAGGSFACGPDGRLLAELPEVEDAAATVELDLREVRRVRTASPMRRDSRPEVVLRELERLRGRGVPGARTGGQKN